MAHEVKDTYPTIGRLVTDASRDISLLISKEIELAKSELKVSVRAGGLGTVLFATAAFLAVLVIIFLSITVAYLIHWNGDGLALQWAYLIVTGAYLAIAAGMIIVGIRLVKKVKAPQRAIAQGKEIPKALRGKS